ncbi:hypothetical protein D9615_005830 [Tricholomella constricta]|uniref:Uncharacterized protein n=1 Tax=Tricholomella constricta TaxID=117010 RepID=A0A8H5HAV0_9AGAR|nr:hypothetical protein D9615_005830 [Tricholomella constricta]
MGRRHPPTSRANGKASIARAAASLPLPKGVKIRQALTPLKVSPPSPAVLAQPPVQKGQKNQHGDDEDEEERRKRKNIMDMHERRRQLEADSWATAVEAKRVKCRGCHRWLKLDQRSMYYRGLWDKHRDQCNAIKSFKGEHVPERTRKSRGTGIVAKRKSGSTPVRSKVKVTEMHGKAIATLDPPAKRTDQGPAEAIHVENAIKQAHEHSLRGFQEDPTVAAEWRSSITHSGQASFASNVMMFDTTRAALPNHSPLGISKGGERTMRPAWKGLVADDDTATWNGLDNPVINGHRNNLHLYGRSLDDRNVRAGSMIDTSRELELTAVVPVEDQVVTDHMTPEHAQHRRADAPTALWDQYTLTDLMGPGLAAWNYPKSIAVASSEKSFRGNAARAPDFYGYHDGAYITNSPVNRCCNDGVFAPGKLSVLGMLYLKLRSLPTRVEMPYNCPRIPCNHRFRFSLQNELDTYFDGANVESMSKIVPPIEPDVLNGARCLVSLSTRLHHQRK